MKSCKNILLINPWIYDFAAYDFWNKPLGLLKIGSVLRLAGYRTSLIDCMDRQHPVFEHVDAKWKIRTKKNGTGKYFRQEIEKPSILKDIPRKYCRYGIPLDCFKELLDKTPFPDAILITSCMTYWYPGVRDAVNILRERFSNVPIFLGGIYATLIQDHARQNIAVDYLISGEGEKTILKILDSLFSTQLYEKCEKVFDNLPYPAFDLYPDLQSIAIETSRGCPYQCSFCASKLLVPEYRRRSPHSVLKELEYWYKKHHVKHYVFYDDALLHKSDEYFKPVLKGIIHNNWKIKMHTPNGLHIRYIDAEMASFMYEAGVQTIRLSFESSDEHRQKKMSFKVSNNNLKQALSNLKNAGFTSNQIGVYVLFGLPDQKVNEVKDSVQFVLDSGGKVKLASFSPIPHTVDWHKAIDYGYLHIKEDPLLTNTTIYPIWSKKYSYSFCTELEQWTREQNINH